MINSIIACIAISWILSFIGSYSASRWLEILKIIDPEKYKYFGVVKIYGRHLLFPHKNIIKYIFKFEFKKYNNNLFNRINYLVLFSHVGMIFAFISGVSIFFLDYFFGK